MSEFVAITSARELSRSIPSRGRYLTQSREAAESGGS
jgi:hypothetical protein